jgi:hypothetical protein
VRQTDLSFEELYDLIEGASRAPLDVEDDRPCGDLGLWVNEIGELAIGDTIQGLAARQYLIRLLKHPSPWVQFPAFGYGIRVPSPTNKLMNALAEFGDDPMNKEIVERAKEIARELAED